MTKASPVSCHVYILAIVFNLAILPGAFAAEGLKQRESALQDAFRDIATRDFRKQHRSPSTVYTEKFEELFGQYLDADGFSGLGDEELAAVRRAVDSVAFYTQDPEMAERLATISNELEARGFDARNAHLAEAYEELIEARLFARAAEFAQRHEGQLAPENFRWISAAKPGSGPSVIEMRDGNGTRELARKPVNIAVGPRLVVIMHPGCAFCRRFRAYIEGDEELAGKFAGRTLWLVRQGATLPIDAILDWNESSTVVDLVVSYRDDEWPEDILFGNTPMFYFLMDSKIVHRVTGWQGETTLSKLETGFDILERRSRVNANPETAR